MGKAVVYIILILLTIAMLITLLSYIFIYEPSLSPNLQSKTISYSEHEKDINVQINEDGTSTESILWKIKVTKRLSYIPVGEWGLDIPKNAEDLSISDPKGQFAFQIVEKPEEKYNLLLFRNRENINYDEEFFFRINYKVPKNPIIYEPFYFYERTFSRFDSDTSFSLTINLPENAELISSTNSPEIISETLSYELEKDSKKQIKIEFRIPDKQPRIRKINSERYSATIPERYAEEYQEILDEADKGFEKIESLYGFSPTFRKLNIEFINYDAVDFEEQTEAYFLGEGDNGEGRVRIKITSLNEEKGEMLYTLLHETLHAFNSRYFDNTNNFWLEEGLAQFLGFKFTEELGYSSSLKKQNEELNILCENEDKSFISLWSPNFYLSSNNKKIQCENILTSPIPLGYAHSYQIVKALSEEYGLNIFRNFFAEAEQSQIQFSSDHKTLNAQVNFLLTEAAGKDTSPILNHYGIQVDGSTEYTPPITGLPIHEDTQKDKNIIYLIVITILAILIITKLLKTSTKKKLRKKLKSFSPYYKFD